MLRNLRAKGPVAVWGAGARVIMFCNFVDPAALEIAAVVDINPAKQKSFVSSTGHRIVRPDVMAELGISTVIVMNESYRDEIERDIKARGLNIEMAQLPREIS